MDNDRIGSFIAKKRLEKKLTQNELGEKLFVTGKAVSKWERGLSLPDISILENLADILDTDIYDILQIKNKKDINLEKVVEDEKKKIKKQLFRKTLLLFVPIFLLLLVLLFKVIPFGFNIEYVRYTHNTNKIVSFGVPKFSFMFQNKENSFSYKNFRGKKSLENEMKVYLNSLEHLSCNDTIYYYNSDADITITEYSVKSNLIYSTLFYNIRNGNYCKQLEKKEYIEKLGGYAEMFYLYPDDYDDSNFRIILYTYIRELNGENKYTADLYVYEYETSEKSKIIEHSMGSFRVEGNDFIYTRNKIDEQGEVEIPRESHFIIHDNMLFLKDDYLSKYEKGITLRRYVK